MSRNRFLNAVLATAFVFTGATQVGAAEFTMKLGHSNQPDPKNSVFHACALKFEGLVEKYTNGRVDVVIFPAFQLGSEQEQVRASQLGTQESTIISTNNLNVFARSLGFLSLPYIFETVAEGRNVIDTGWDKFNEWSTKEAGVRLLTVIDAGFRDLTTNDAHPVRNLADLRKAKIRVPPNPIMIGAFKSWGVEPMPLAWSETFNALQQKVVDGQENPINVMLAVKFYEVQKYVTNMSYIYQSNFLVASERWFQSLPTDLQAAVVRAGKETTDWERDYIEATTKSDIARLKADHGIIFLGEPEDKPEWVKRARAIWPDYYDFIGKGDADKGKKVVDAVIKMTAEYRAKNK